MDETPEPKASDFYGVQGVQLSDIQAAEVPEPGPTVLDVWCPYCGARGGALCRAKSGSVREVPHDARQNVWSGYRKGYADCHAFLLNTVEREHGKHALWRAEVVQQETLLGFSDWLAWHQAEDDDTDHLDSKVEEFYS
jgi:hypothetical protein